MNSLTQVVFTILFGLLHRNMMVEAARFSHGQGATQMQDLSKLDVNSFDGIIFPGGQGVIKNLWGTLRSLLHHFELWTERRVCWRWKSNIAHLISLDPLLRRMEKIASCMAKWRGCWRNSTAPASPLGMDLDETFQSIFAEWRGRCLSSTAWRSSASTTSCWLYSHWNLKLYFYPSMEPTCRLTVICPTL